MGVRPLQGLIDEKIKKPLTGELLFGKLEAKKAKVHIFQRR